MITSLRLFDFKNFTNETLRLGPFTVIIGANGSGKSNIRDAFRFLHGIGRGYTLAEIIGGKYGAGGQIDWVPIRGAANEIIRFQQPAFSMEVELQLANETATFLIEVSPELETVRSDGFRITYECLRIRQEVIYEKLRNAYEDMHVVLGDGRQIDIKRGRPVLAQLHESRQAGNIYKDRTRQIIDALHSMRFLELSPARMREPSFSGANVLGNFGENLPTVLEKLCADPKREKILASWVHELTPMDVQGFAFPRDLNGRAQLMIRETNGRKVSAYSASDGTLRFLAMLGALLGTDPARLYFFEEIDNGIHPARLHLLIDLIERQTATTGIQVITTTHSPDLLSAVNEKTFENTSVVCRLEDTNDAIIRPVADLSNARELRKSQGLGRLLTGGWMETALAFSEGNEDAAEGSE